MVWLIWQQICIIYKNKLQKGHICLHFSDRNEDQPTPTRSRNWLPHSLHQPTLFHSKPLPFCISQVYRWTGRQKLTMFSKFSWNTLIIIFKDNFISLVTLFPCFTCTGFPHFCSFIVENPPPPPQVLSLLWLLSALACFSLFLNFGLLGEFWNELWTALKAVCCNCLSFLSMHTLGGTLHRFFFRVDLTNAQACTS